MVQKGEINDISTEESVEKVEGSEFSYHIIGITPSTRAVMDLELYKESRFDIHNFPEPMD